MALTISSEVTAPAFNWASKPLAVALIIPGS